MIYSRIYFIHASVWVYITRINVFVLLLHVCSIQWHNIRLIFIDSLTNFYFLFLLTGHGLKCYQCDSGIDTNPPCTKIVNENYLREFGSDFVCYLLVVEKIDGKISICVSKLILNFKKPCKTVVVVVTSVLGQDVGECKRL